MRKLVIIGMILVGSAAFTQDIHFSQFDMNPVFLNPALTGNHECDWRFSANQRSQWKSVSRPYNTIGISAENRSGWILPSMYHGVNIFHDVAGDGDFRTIEFNISTAYEFYLDNDSLHSVAPGIQIGLNHRVIDFSALTWDNQYNGYYFDAGLGSGENFGTNRRTGFNANVGVIYNYRPAHRKSITAGFGWFNIPQVKQSFYGDDLIKRDMRFVLHGNATWQLNYQWDIQPAMMLQFQGKYREIIVGANARYIIRDKRGEFLAPYAGVYWRNQDAAYLMAGVYYNQWRAGISYDINFSQLVPASNLRGGIEFSVQYILCIFKPKQIQHRVCPDYL